MHQAGHEPAEHLLLSRSVCFRSITEVGVLRVEIVLQRLIKSFGDQLVGEEFEIRLVVSPIAEVVSKVILRDWRRRLSDRALVTRIDFVPLTEELPACPHSVNRKHVVSGVAVGWPLMSETSSAEPERGDRRNSLVISQVVEEDVVGLVIVF